MAFVYQQSYRWAHRGDVGYSRADRYLTHLPDGGRRIDYGDALQAVSAKANRRASADILTPQSRSQETKSVGPEMGTDECVHDFLAIPCYRRRASRRPRA